MMTAIHKSAAADFDALVRSTAEFSGEDFRLRTDGEYAEVLTHIREHKYFTNENIPYEISMRDAVFSWYEEVYEPLMLAIDKSRLAKYVPDATRGELYLWISRHWHFLKQSAGPQVSAEQAVFDFGSRFSKPGFARLWFRLRAMAA